jgi:hypothetical protein
MAAGLGYKEFTTGDVLTAADANGYLASQVVMVFASAAARTSAIASPQEGMISYLKDTNSTEYYSGSAWVAIGGAGGGMTLISTTALTGTTVSLSSFSGYTDLQLLIIGAYGSNQNTVHARFNADSGNNYYAGRQAYGLGENVQNKALLGDGLSNSSTNVTLRNYTLLKLQKYASSEGKTYQVQSGYIYWNNTAINFVTNTQDVYTSSTAITSIDLFLASGNFSGGTAYLYGVK